MIVYSISYQNVFRVLKMKHLTAAADTFLESPQNMF